MADTTEAVAQQYREYPYPDINYRASLDLVDGCDPSVYSNLIWPEGRPRPDLDILVAGCGTRQAARIAHKNRDCRVLAIDISETSINLSREAAAGLDNVEFKLCDLRAPLDRQFDLIFATGVLHHLDDPDEGLRALGAALKPDGAINVMLYAPLGRHGVYLMQDVIRRLGIKPDEDGIKFAREFTASLPSQHPFSAYAKTAGELTSDAALVDTLFHPRDRAYSVPDVFALVRNAGLEFQSWYDNFLYYPEGSVRPTSAFWHAIKKLDDEQQAAVMENTYATAAQHSFIARRKARRIDFAGTAWRDYVVKQTRPIKTVKPADASTPGEYSRDGLPMFMSAAEALLLKLCDGKRRMIETTTYQAFSKAPRPQVEEFARTFFERMWKSGHIIVGLPG